MADAQFGVEALQFLQGVLHRKDAANDDGALSIDIGHALEHLREALVHSVGYAAVLFGTEQGEFAQSLVGLVAQQRHAAQHILSIGSEFAHGVGSGEHLEGSVVVVLAYEVARTVTSVVADVVGLVAFRGWCEFLLLGSRIGIVVAARLEDVLLELLTRRLCPSGGTSKQ